jgi:hypothetical protein
VPTVGLPPVVPFTCHVTAVSGVLLTVAVKACVPPFARTLADSGVTATAMVGVVTSTSVKSRASALSVTVTQRHGAAAARCE